MITRHAESYTMRELLARALAYPPPKRRGGAFFEVEPTRTVREDQRRLKAAVEIAVEDIITPSELAARLKVPESWVFSKSRARCRNKIPCLRIGRYIRFDWAAVIQWLREQASTEPSNGKRPKKGNRHA